MPPRHRPRILLRRQPRLTGKLRRQAGDQPSRARRAVPARSARPGASGRAIGPSSVRPQPVRLDQVALADQRQAEEDTPGPTLSRIEARRAAIGIEARPAEACPRRARPARCRARASASASRGCLLTTPRSNPAASAYCPRRANASAMIRCDRSADSSGSRRRALRSARCRRASGLASADGGRAGDAGARLERITGQA